MYGLPIPMLLMGSIIVGSIVGYIAWRVRKEQGVGLQGSLIAGAVGALLLSFLLSSLGIGFSYSLIGVIITSLLGAVLLLLVADPIMKSLNIKPASDSQGVAEQVIPTEDRGINSSIGGESAALMKRYKDAYLVARTMIAIGAIIKGIGVILGSVIAVISFGAAGQFGSGAMGGIGLVSGIFVAILFFLFSILVKAQGQILQASLDSAVNSSPFLSNEQRTRAMSLY
ncbi:MAG: GlsB/YeaQ/YmgE family stress response membrane protein [Calditrichaceae bacterium]|nr:GlsB/YeaQ/YmgE family stress response membrane protein [Calditrichia bacterium]NUQ41056.1 GlsB/YeaQ/YmgE family stress response membrane protein [Calditrichaceae bacterium]